ncbi:NAD dependent epimerase/dehydratase family protein [Halogranum amylolyticum]|uniref:NAD dependent epimerase/dehydratase family protein n=1 Tax=Halogranum amylolyticum TaxID=660520 RepID=A0A1H8QBV1_9EURY|nr:NAD(P)-dependent oxidoreductase [Halogranum amylolyticum]SEO51481.1 NAD dependent epimerase/dehydratase family protein [Halogranum amylolyticum]
MTHVAITGAAGNVGKVAVDAFAETDHDLTLFTHSEHDDLDSTVLDVTEREAFVDELPDDADVLVHLAANPSPYAEWDAVSEVNVDGVYNAYHAAVENDLSRVVYASSNHTINATAVADPTEPETLTADASAMYPDDDTAPDSYYGVTKVAGEAMGKFYAHRHGLDVVNLRIGWLMSESELRETVDDPPSEYESDAVRFARAMWLSPRDCRDAIVASATADLPETPVTAHAISRNADRVLSLTETLRTLGYDPRDDAARVLDD